MAFAPARSERASELVCALGGRPADLFGLVRNGVKALEDNRLEIIDPHEVHDRAEERDGVVLRPAVVKASGCVGCVTDQRA